MPRRDYPMSTHAGRYIEGPIAEVAGWRPVLDARAGKAAVRLEGAKLDAGEPWCAARIVGAWMHARKESKTQRNPWAPPRGARSIRA